MVSYIALIILSAKIFLSALCASLALAVPTRGPTRFIAKRTPPVVATGFTADQVKQIEDAFRDALELASYAASLPGLVVNPILEKYFDAGEHDLVDSEFLPALCARERLLMGYRRSTGCLGWRCKHGRRKRPPRTDYSFARLSG